MICASIDSSVDEKFEFESYEKHVLEEEFFVKFFIGDRD